MEDKKFMLSDGSYCSLNGDRLLIHDKKEIKNIPGEKEPSRVLPVSLLSAGIVILAFFTIQFFRTGMLVFAGLFTMVAVFLIYLLFEQTTQGFSKNIPLKNIHQSFYVSPKLGFDFFILVYSDDKGVKRKRKLKLYDSKENIERAKLVMLSAGLYRSN